MDNYNEKVKAQLLNLWNWCGNNKPDDFKEADGKQWLNIGVERLATKLNISEITYLMALRALFDAKEIDVKKVNSNQIMYSLSPEPEANPIIQPTQTRSIEDKWSAYFDSMNPSDKWNLWNITINKEWAVCSPEAKARFPKGIADYLMYRRGRPVAEVIKQRVYQKIQSGEFTNVYAPNIVITAEEARKQFAKGWSTIQTTGVDFKSMFSIENEDTPPDPF